MGQEARTGRRRPMVGAVLCLMRISGAGSPKMAPPKNLGTNSQRHRAGGKVGAGKAIDIF